MIKHTQYFRCGELIIKIWQCLTHCLTCRLSHISYDLGKTADVGQPTGQASGQTWLERNKCLLVDLKSPHIIQTKIIKYKT